MQSRSRHFWIPFNAALIAFVSGYLFASGGFSFSRSGKPVTQSPLDATEPVTTPAPLTPPVPSSTPVPFHWSQLESTDYATYIANLRAIGCPEPTVRDIISGDLASVYAQKRQALLATQSQAAPEIQNKALKALDAEQRSVQARLLEPPSAPKASGTPSFRATSPAVTTAFSSGATAASGASSATSAATDSSASGQTTEAAESTTPAPAEETAASTTGSSGTRKWRSPFTPEEEAYRTKYGWRAFDEAQREAVRQENP